MKLLQLVNGANKDTAEALDRLMAARQSLKGMLVYYRDDDGHEDAIFTGLYKSSAAEALMAAMRVSGYLTKL